LADVTPFAPCVNPANEIVQERLVDPLDLMRDLDRVGFATRMIVPAEWEPQTWRRRGGDWKGFATRLAVWLSWRLPALRPALLRGMDHFLAVARKR
jgi:hypothetical protein